MVRRNLGRQRLKKSKYLFCHFFVVFFVIFFVISVLSVIFFVICLSFFLSFQFCLSFFLSFFCRFFCHFSFVCHFVCHLFVVFFVISVSSVIFFCHVFVVFFVISVFVCHFSVIFRRLFQSFSLFLKNCTKTTKKWQIFHKMTKKWQKKLHFCRWQKLHFSKHCHFFCHFSVIFRKIFRSFSLFLRKLHQNDKNPWWLFSSHLPTIAAPRNVIWNLPGHLRFRPGPWTLEGSRDGESSGNCSWNFSWILVFNIVQWVSGNFKGMTRTTFNLHLHILYLQMQVYIA